MSDMRAAELEEGGRDISSRHRIEDMLVNADRMMMQTVQTALSLIGFGLTINAFFNDVAAKAGIDSAAIAARRMGIAMLALGLFFLAAGIAGQAGFRARAHRRLKAHYASGELQDALRRPYAPTVLLAFLLLALAVVALATTVLREFAN